MPTFDVAMADYPAGAIDGAMRPLTGAMWASEGWRFSDLMVPLDRWQFLKRHTLTIAEEVTAEDALVLGSRANAFPEEASAEDAWSWSASLTQSQDEILTLADDMQFRTQAAPLEADTEVWCVNVDTGASSRYEQYGFNSFFESGGVLYGVAADGVYRLDSDADAGNRIESLIYVGQTDFDTNRVKYLPKVYFGGASSRPIHVQVSADGVDRTYEARNWSSTLDVHRVDCGVGVKANYWGITLKNSGGADYAVDAVMLTPITTLRRM
jgi:hypothetical protein